MRGPDGLSFLGNEFRLHRRYKIYVPVGKEDHAWSSLRFPMRNCRSILDSAERVIGIWITYFYCRRVCDWCEWWIHKHRNELAHAHDRVVNMDLIGEFMLPGVPTRRQIDDLWTGKREAAGPMGDCRILKLPTMSGKQSKQQKKKGGAKKNGYTPPRGVQGKAKIVYVPRAPRQPRPGLQVSASRPAAAYSAHTKAARISSFADGTVVLEGSELVGTLYLSAAPAIGEVLFTLAMSGCQRQLTLKSDTPVYTLWNVPVLSETPSLVQTPATRIGGLMQFWSKFVLEKAELKFVPCVPFTTGGAIAMIATTDPTEALPSGGGGVNWRQAIQRQNYVETMISKPATLRVPVDSRQHCYVDRRGATDAMTEAAVRQYAPSLVQVIAGSGIGTSGIHGNFFLDYRIRLMNPELPQSEGTAQAVDSEAVALQLGSAPLANGATSIPIAPSGGTLVKNTSYDDPSWINSACKIIQAGMYMYSIVSNLQAATANTQLNNTSTYSASLGNAFTAFTEGLFNVTGSASQFATMANKVTFEVTDSMITGAGGAYPLPGFINLSAAKNGDTLTYSGNAKAAVGVILSKLASPVALTGKRRARPVELDPGDQLIFDWLETFPDERSWGSHFFTVHGCGEGWGVSWPTLEETLVNDIENGTPTAQGLFGGASSSGTYDEGFELVEMDAMRRQSVFGAPTTMTNVRRVPPSTPR